MVLHSRLIVSAVTLLSCVLPVSARAQGYPFSQRASVTQSIAFTDVEVSYGRPIARGRVLFPGVVKWGQTWNPGADSATRITLSRDVRIEGREVKAGAYSLWLIPRASEPWIVVLSRAAHVFHTPYPGDSLEALRVEVTPEQGAHMETLAIYFPAVIRNEAVMRVHWGTTIVPIRITASNAAPQ
jgi:hypothetical protein